MATEFLNSSKTLVLGNSFFIPSSWYSLSKTSFGNKFISSSKTFGFATTSLRILL